MSSSMEGIKKTFIQENTTLNPYRLVKLGTAADEVVAATADTDVLFGVTDESADATAGNPVWVVIGGIVKLCIASASAKGGYIWATTDGKWVLVTADKKSYVWVLLETTTASNQIAQVVIRPGLISAT